MTLEGSESLSVSNLHWHYNLIQDTNLTLIRSAIMTAEMGEVSAVN